MSAPRPSMIRGLATDTMVLSIRIMKNPMTSDHRAGQGFATFSTRSSFGIGFRADPERLAQEIEDLLAGKHLCRCACGRRAGVRVGAGGQQDACDVGVTLERGPSEGGLPAVVGSIGRGAVLQNQLHGVRVDRKST